MGHGTDGGGRNGKIWVVLAHTNRKLLEGTSMKGNTLELELYGLDWDRIRMECEFCGLS